MMQTDEQFMKYFPSKMAKGRVPDREYFFNVLNTFQGEYLRQLVKNASEQRNSGKGEARAMETIEVSDEWWKALNEIPFVSRKCFLRTIIAIYPITPSRVIWRYYVV